MQSEFADEWDKWLKTDEGLKALRDTDEADIKAIFIAGAEASERTKEAIYEKLLSFKSSDHCPDHGGTAFMGDCIRCNA